MPDPLPVESIVPDLQAALGGPGTCVLVAPPGSGKTTVIPLRLWEEPWLEGRRVLVLEPRRIATRAAARRMADTLGEDVGETVGYTTRDDRRVSPRTRVEVVTEGVLTRRLQADPELPGVGVILFDEFHERNLQTDLGLALALDVRASIRPDLRIVVMSATVDAERVAALLSDPPAPTIVSEARQHPVELRWRPFPRRGRLDEHVAAVVSSALDEEVGDVLVFLPGMGEITRVADHLERRGAPCEIHVLHGSLPAAAQDAALLPSMRRKVVLSTDIAETSLTVEGVRIVVDSGLARAPRFDARTGMSRLLTVPISRSSADQRAGRAGRTEPGICYRAWSKMEHGTRRPHIDPEITQVDLTSLVLELRAWGTDDPGSLRLLDRPPPSAWSEAGDLLERLGAVENGRPSSLGRAMLRLPTHPRLARMVLEAQDGWLACILAALVDERDPIRGRWSDLPVDLALRVGLVEGKERHPDADRRSVDRVAAVARELARRAGITPGTAEPGLSGEVLALAFPDRLAIRRGSPGRFRLRGSGSAWLPSSDPLAVERFLVVADLDGKRKDARIRLAAAIDADAVPRVFADAVEEQVELDWEDGRVVEVRRRRIGGIDLDERRRRADPGPEAAAVIADRLTPAMLEWNARAAALRHRVTHLHRAIGPPWPDWSDAGLSATLADWLGPTLPAVTSLDELQRLDPGRILERSLEPRLRTELDRLAPAHITLPGGRRLPVDYSGESPTISSRVQDFFGIRETPSVAGVPLVVELLSPAGRPVQVTSDLAGFWSGSWHEVRKEMAGRYPKHDWPEDPGRGSRG